MNNKLKPRPFCGSVARIECDKLFRKSYFNPECTNECCIASDTMMTFRTEEEAIEAWNRRYTGD